ncbi:bacteriocin [Oceanivirga salmonicida]|uniref:bacteriocin n=1 Tax=Oceanivirga salmonicida TaxID=1769291 RepID=UPI0012E34076|nr:Blp family class II bacteriocin [Oceanivirga salmonicida]
MIKEINEKELMEINGGFVITGTMVATGIGIFVGGFVVGKGIGTMIKKWTH